MSDEKTAQPMDPGAREETGRGATVRRTRRAYALDTLVDEVREAFGEVEVTYGAEDNWNVIHDVTFKTLDKQHLADLLLLLAPQDERIRGDVYLSDDQSEALVQFHHNRRIQDTREGFGVQAILDVLSEDDAPTIPVVASSEPIPAGMIRVTPLDDDGQPIGEPRLVEGRLTIYEDEPEPEPVPVKKPPARKAPAKKTTTRKTTPKKRS